MSLQATDSVDASKTQQLLAVAGALYVHLVTTLVGEDVIRDVQKTITELNYTAINATGNTVVKASSGAYFGYKILANAGAFNLNVYDNASTNSGQQMEVTAGISVAAAADGRRDTGVKCVNGITVAMSGDPTDALILIFWL